MRQIDMELLEGFWLFDGKIFTTTCHVDYSLTIQNANTISYKLESTRFRNNAIPVFFPGLLWKSFFFLVVFPLILFHVFFLLSVESSRSRCYLSSWIRLRSCSILRFRRILIYKATTLLSIPFFFSTSLVIKFVYFYYIFFLRPFFTWFIKTSSIPDYIATKYINIATNVIRAQHTYSGFNETLQWKFIH